MNLIPLFKDFVKKGSQFYSPLFSTVTFNDVRKFNPMEENSPLIIECKTLAGNVVIFNHEGKPIIFHPSGEMIYETNMGECMIQPQDGTWKDLVDKIKELM